MLSINCFASDLEISDQHVRATPPHAKNSAAFLTVKNTTDKDVKLVAASSDIAQRVELHTHSNVDGVMKMRQVEEIMVSANSSATLQAGGNHIMFLGLNNDLLAGQNVDLVLYFDNGDEVKVTAPIEKIDVSKQMADDKHQH